MKAKIKVKNGFGKPVNPHDMYHGNLNPKWKEFDDTNPPFLAIDQNNNPVDSFEADGELRYQYLHVGKFWKFCDSEAQYEKMKASGFAFTRQVWLIEVAEEREIAERAAYKFAQHNTRFPISMTIDQINHSAKQVELGFLAGAKYASSNSIDRRNLQDAKNIAECLQQVIDMGMVHFDNDDDKSYLPRLIEILKTL